VDDQMQDVPRNPAGKVLKREFRAPYWEAADKENQ
jgi:hypothetical protein